MDILEILKAISDVAIEQQSKAITDEESDAAADWTLIHGDAVSLRRRLEGRLEEADWPEELDHIEEVDL